MAPAPRNQLRQALSSSAPHAGGPTALASGTTCRGGSARPGLFASRAVRGFTAITSLLDYRAGAFLLPCARPVLFGAVLILSSPAHGGGLDEVAVDVAACPAATMQNDGSMTAAMFAQWLAVRRMACPDLAVARRRFFDAGTGDELTDAEIWARILNGSKPVETLTPVPLPGSAWAMLAGLGGLALLRRRG